MNLISSKADNSQEKKSCHAEEDTLISELLCDLSAPDRSKSLSDIRTNIIGACSDTNSCGIHPFDTGRLKGDLPADIAEGFYSRCNEDWYKNAGFTDEERAKMTELLAAGFTDSFRHLHPDATGIYSWWSYRFKARQNNAGWRIDYFIVSDRIKDKIQKAEILTDIMGSDHCPVLLEIDL